MGKVDSFQILLEKLNKIYTAGEVVKGKLVVKISERLKINDLSLILKGEGRVHWTERRKSGKNSHTVAYYAGEDYAYSKLVFLAKQANDDCYIEVGEQSFPFEFQLSKTLPISFEHIHARVRYYLRGYIDIPWAIDKSVNLSITVVNNIDLNLTPTYRQPKTGVQIKTLCCLCCKSDPIIARLSISKTGFVSGETLSFKAILDNKSSSTMKHMSFQIIQYVLCITRSKSRIFERIVCDLPYPNQINEKMCEEWNNSIVIPPVCPSSNGLTKILIISYGAVLCVTPSGAHMSFEASIPIVIGTIPLTQDNQESYKPFSFEASRFAAEKNSELDDKPKGEVTNMDVNFLPSYPYYKDFSIKI